MNEIPKDWNKLKGLNFLKFNDIYGDPFWYNLFCGAYNHHAKSNEEYGIHCLPYNLFCGAYNHHAKSNEEYGRQCIKIIGTVLSIGYLNSKGIINNDNFVSLCNYLKNNMEDFAYKSGQTFLSFDCDWQFKYGIASSCEIFYNAINKMGKELINKKIMTMNELSERVISGCISEKEFGNWIGKSGIEGYLKMLL